NLEQKQIHEQEESPIHLVETPILYQLPPKKPPRTFEHDRKKDNLKKLIDQQVPSSESSNENSPIFDR
ncbi:unnamed protein product, partial [Rotaria sp. Silwood1]